MITFYDALTTTVALTALLSHFQSKDAADRFGSVVLGGAIFTHRGAAGVNLLLEALPATQN